MLSIQIDTPTLHFIMLLVKAESLSRISSRLE